MSVAVRPFSVVCPRVYSEPAVTNGTPPEGDSDFQNGTRYLQVGYRKYRANLSHIRKAVRRRELGPCSKDPNIRRQWPWAGHGLTDDWALRTRDQLVQ
jgi:hypothetical protein